ncbi:MAG: ATP-binding cassette domain-containing protein [Cellvibrionaceae bacterium]|nr:ATP-binding cassette domain-containing protein [Cellvibrionaceae bacterium]
MIKAVDIRHSVPVSQGTLEILKGINLEIQPGESAAIIGASGSGKSTLLGMLAGLDSPSSGEIILNQREITQLNEEDKARMRAELVAFVFQNFQLLSSLTALENVMLPMEVRGDKAAHNSAQAFLERVGLTEREHHYPSQLSGGEQQRVALARAFASQAPILFADEPTGNLDTDTGLHIADLMFTLNKETQTTLVLVTHDQQLAARCDRQFVMHAGELSQASSEVTL